MLPKIIDNSAPHYEMKSVFAEQLKSDKFKELTIATGYWDLPGMVDIFDELTHLLSRDGVRSVCFWVHLISTTELLNIIT